MKKKLLVVGLALLGVVVVSLVAAVLLVDANQFRPQLESRLTTALGRPVTIASLRTSLLSGGIALEGLTIADDPAFSRDAFVTAKSVSVGVDLVPLIVSRSLRVESFRLDEPQVTLRRSASGTWNFSTLGASSASSSSGGATTAATSVLVRELRITNGRLVVERANGASQRRTYDDVTVDVTNLSYTAPFPFTASAKTPGGGTAKLEGHAGPFNTGDASKTPFAATLDLKQLDIAQTGFVDPGSGLRALLDFAGGLTSDGTRMTTKGTARATNVQVLPGGAAAAVPVVVEYESAYDAGTQRGTVKQGDVHIGKAIARLTGDYDARGDTTRVRMQLRGDKMPVTDLQAALPAVGVTLPTGATLKQGALNTALAIEGPLDRLVISGPVSLTDGILAGFDLGAKMKVLASFAGLPSLRDTPIETLTATLRVAPERIDVDALNMVVPTIGTLSGSGAITPAPPDRRGNAAEPAAMNFTMLAKLKEGTTSGGVARVTSFAQTRGIPFRVQGTTSEPTFVPDVGGAVKSGVADAVKNPDTLKKAADALGGLFGRKKSEQK